MATPYHRLAREHPDHGWWRLPVAGLIGVMGYLGAMVGVGIALVPVVLVLAPDDPDALDRYIDDLLSGALTSPWMLAFMLATIALMLPAVLLGTLATGPRPRPVGYLSSVAGRLRWGWLARVGLLALVVYTGAILGGLALGLGGELSAPSLANDAVAFFLVALLLVPVQATAEEYVFRGYLFQLVGSWTRWAIVPVLVSTPLFVAGHGYDFWGLVDVTVFALMACFLVIRTGGLEAAIAAHVANNLVLFSLEAFNVFAVTSQEYGAIDVLPTVGTSIVFVLLVEWRWRAGDLERTRPPLPPKPPPMAWLPVQSYPYPPQPYPYGQPYPPQPYPYAQPYPPVQQPYRPAPVPAPPPPPGGTP